ncbi:glycosyltransferase family 4 protein, partial [Vibrio vulnificus]|nr:glycosyltransferase family 4 protein [Vibrio vulnificus]
MKKIALVTPSKAYLPELLAYQTYFSSKYEVKIVNLSDDLSPYDILWFFMGTDGRGLRDDQYIIHEYASLSKPPLSRIKNFLKKVIVSKPDLRIFLNEQVRSEMNFRDSIPSVIRDMGVSSSFTKSPVDCSYYQWDYIYVGAMDASRKLYIAIDKLLKLNPKAKIALVGEPNEKLVKRYDNYSVDFIGRVDYASIPRYLIRAKYALNYVPDVYPYNIQTSTKFLEYIACGCCVITNKYKWVKEYCSNNNLNVIYLDDIDLSIRSSLTCNSKLNIRDVNFPM